MYHNTYKRKRTGYWKERRKKEGKAQHIPAGQACPQGSMPALRLLSGAKIFFHPAAATHCSDKREIWHGESDLRSAPPPCQFSRLSELKCGNSHQNGQNLEFCPQICPSKATRLHIINELLSVCKRIQKAFKLLIWSLSGDKQPSYKHFHGVGALSLKFSFCLFVTLSNYEVCDNENAIKQCNFQNNYGAIAPKRFSTWPGGIALPRRWFLVTAGLHVRREVCRVAFTRDTFLPPINNEIWHTGVRSPC